MTTNRVVYPTRFTQAAKNAVANFECKVEQLFAEIRNAPEAWLEAFTLHCATEVGLLEILEKFFRIGRASDLNISIKKSDFFTPRVRCRGRLIVRKGYQFDPRNLSGRQNLHLPQNAGELCEFVHCLQWMANSIPKFSNRFAPF